MKTIGISLLFSLLTIQLFGQAGIKIYTKLDEAKFKIVFNGELENTIPIKEIEYDSLDFRKTHEVVLTFNSDTIADIEEEILLLENQVREFEILKKSDIRKKTSKIGRKIGKVLKVGKHDKEHELWDVFYLQERTKSEYMNN